MVVVGKVSFPSAPAISLFNGPLETGLRAVIVLDACFPRTLDATKLTWLDHLVVHTADVGGPRSLHPNIPQRTGELLIRRRLVEEGLQLMRKLHMVAVLADADGICFQATEGAAPFVEGLKTDYATQLKICARWITEYFIKNEENFSLMIEDKVGKWAVEFQGEVNRFGEIS